jgi:hypothetical protein
MLNTTYFISSYPYLNSMVSNDMPSKVCHKSSMDKLVLSPDTNKLTRNLYFMP